MSLENQTDWELNVRLYSEKELKSTYKSLVADLEKSPHDSAAIMLLHLVEKELKSRGLEFPKTTD